MDFLFFGVFQKQLEIFHNTAYPARGRIKAFQSILLEADKNKSDNQEKIRNTLKDEAVILFDVCVKALRSYDYHSAPISANSPNTKPKADGKLSNEIEDILALLQRLFNEFPIEKIAEIPADDFYKILYSVLRHVTADKYKSYGFFLLTAYINLLRRAKLPINEVSSISFHILI